MNFSMFLHILIGIMVGIPIGWATAILFFIGKRADE